LSDNKKTQAPDESEYGEDYNEAAHSDWLMTSIAGMLTKSGALFKGYVGGPMLRILYCGVENEAKRLQKIIWGLDSLCPTGGDKK
jgi:hypothetical protein